MIKPIDPRAKLIFIACISSLAVTFTDLKTLVIISFITVVTALFFKVDFIRLWMRFRKLILTLVGIIIIQSIFTRGGEVIFALGPLALLTDVGMTRGLGYLMRVVIIMLSGAIIATSNMRDLVQALVQFKLPYDLAFMASIGIKFLPMLMEELKDTLTAIQLRGISISDLSFIEKIKLYSYIFTPVIVSTLKKAKHLAISVEARGFRAYPVRTSIRKLTFRSFDYVIILGSITMTLVIFLLSRGII